MLPKDGQVLNIVDENDNIIGQATRKEIHEKGLLHREIHVWFITPKGEIIFQHRAKDKDTYPDLLDATVGGHVEMEDNYEKTALKEMEEETGIRGNIKDLHFIAKFKKRSEDNLTRTINNTIRTQYAYVYRGKMGNLQVEKGKALGFEAWPINQLSHLNDEDRKKFIPLILGSDMLNLFQKMRAFIGKENETGSGDISEVNRLTYDALAEQYEGNVNLRRGFNAKIIEHFIPFIKTGKKVLDIGCAVGLDLKIFREEGFMPVGVDFSREMVKFARKRNPGLRVIEGNFMTIDFNEQFDAVFAQSFIHLFPKKESEKVLQKIYSLLKKGGVAHVTTSKSQRSSEGWVEKSDYRGHLKRFRKFWTKEELHAALEEVGLNIVDYYEIDDPLKENWRWMIFTVKK